MSSRKPLVVVVLSDDDEPAGAEVPEQTVAAKEPEEAERPDWLPDGWSMDATRLGDGTYNRSYTAPISNYTFTTKGEVLDYISSGAADRALEAYGTICDKSTLQGKYAWLPHGWVLEIRAGGEEMDKMFKFYVHLSTGVRLLSKEDVLLFINEEKISSRTMSGKCDISFEDNILALLEFGPDGLPAGWVKEVEFTNNDKGVRKDNFYTDPGSGLVFRGLASAKRYFTAGIIDKYARTPRKSVTENYFFDNCTHMPQLLKNRLKIEGATKRKSKKGSRKELPNGQTSSASEGGGTSAGLDPLPEPKEKKPETAKTRGEEAVASETGKRPRGRPRKILKKAE